MLTKGACRRAEAPSSNTQIPNKSHTSKFQAGPLRASSVLIDWDLEFPWGLDVEIWDFPLGLLGQSIDSFGQAKIKLGQAALAVGGENQTYFIITNINVGMMFLFLGHF